MAVCGSLGREMIVVKLLSHSSVRISVAIKTRSQALARIAERTASQHLRGSRDYLIAHMPFPIVGPLVGNKASVSNGFRDIQRRMSRNG